MIDVSTCNKEFSCVSLIEIITFYTKAGKFENQNSHFDGDS